jgi:hypothetical protein
MGVLLNGSKPTLIVQIKLILTLSKLCKYGFYFLHYGCVQEAIRDC